MYHIVARNFYFVIFVIRFFLFLLFYILYNKNITLKLELNIVIKSVIKISKSN